MFCNLSSPQVFLWLTSGELHCLMVVFLIRMVIAVPIPGLAIQPGPQTLWFEVCKLVQEDHCSSGMRLLMHGLLEHPAQ